ncbi:MAG: excalibur calcium-binding domain-containing protein, partial [Mesorhizobium sp.]
GHGDNAQSAVSQPVGIISRQQVAQSYSCQPRRKCSQISSCDEAQWYLSNCPWGGKLDRDGDGQACETLC